MRNGGLREVDASIRYTVGTSPLLITVECRDRGRTQDITWIEQLITKKQNIGANLTIAVTPEGLTRSAMLLAKQNNIEVRLLKNLTSEEILKWPLLTTGYETSIVQHVYLSGRMVFENDQSLTGVPLDMHPDVFQKFNVNVLDTPIIFRANDQSCSINQMIAEAERAGVKLDDGLTAGETKKKHLVVKYEPRTNAAKTVSGMFFLQSFDVELEVKLYATARHTATVSSYSRVDAPIAVVSEARIEIPSGPSFTITEIHRTGP